MMYFINIRIFCQYFSDSCDSEHWPELNFTDPDILVGVRGADGRVCSSLDSCLTTSALLPTDAKSDDILGLQLEERWLQFTVVLWKSTTWQNTQKVTTWSSSQIIWYQGKSSMTSAPWIITPSVLKLRLSQFFFYMDAHVLLLSLAIMPFSFPFFIFYSFSHSLLPTNS